MARFGFANKKYGKQDPNPPKHSCNFNPYVIVGISAIVCYLNSLFGEFVYDDYEVIETNADVRPSTPFSNLFTNDFWGLPLKHNDSHQSYRPITILTFRGNYLVGGLNPIGYHIINVLLHSTVSVLFFHICTRILNRHVCEQAPSLSVLCGLFFASHPIHTEAVSNVVGRADLLCGLFYLLTILSYINCFSDASTSEGNKRQGRYSKLWLLLSIFWCILALFSKEQGITAFGICVVYDVLFVCKSDGQNFLKGNFSVLTVLRSRPRWLVRLFERVSILSTAGVVLLYLRIVIISGGVTVSFTESDNPTLFHPDFWTRFRTYSYLCALNARLLLCPNTLCYDWSMDSIPRIESWWDMRNVETLAFALILGWLCFYGFKPSNESISVSAISNQDCSKSLSLDSNKNTVYKNHKAKETNQLGDKRVNLDGSQRKRIVLLALSMIIIPFIPATNLFFPVGFVIAERILYIPSMGFCILVSLGILVLFRATKIPSRKELSFYQEHEGSGHSIPSHNSYACTYRTAIGDKYFQKHYSGYGDIFNEDTTNNDQRITKEESTNWNFSLSMPGWIIVYSLLLMYVLKTVHRNSEWQTKERLARSGLKVNPTNAKIHVTLGNVLANKGLLSCESHYREALRLRPHYVTAWENLGIVLLNSGRPEEAEKCYLKSLSIKPNSADGNINLAHLLRVTERFREADGQYQKALTLRPNHPQLNYFHGVVLEKLGNRKKAEEKYLKTAKLTPTDPSPFRQLGRMYAIPLLKSKVKTNIEKAFKKAEGFLRKGLLLKPPDTYSRLLLVQLYLIKGNFDSAETEVRLALRYDANSKDGEFILGRILEIKGSLKEAREHFHKVLKMDYRHSGALSALQRINNKTVNYIGSFAYVNP